MKLQELDAAGRPKKWVKQNAHLVDLDATLALDTGWKGEFHIGPPVPAMLRRVKAWLRKGERVKIFTARVDDLVQFEGNRGELREWRLYEPDQAMRQAIQNWCLKWVGQKLEVTNRKDKWTVDIWDDRARQVQRNTGRLMTQVLADRLAAHRRKGKG